VITHVKKTVIQYCGWERLKNRGHPNPNFDSQYLANYLGKRGHSQQKEVNIKHRHLIYILIYDIKLR
jgi:hypothetical protein